VRNLAKVDAEAKAEFDALVADHSASLLRFGYLLTRDWGLAEDLLQTALAKTWFRWGKLRDTGAADAYVRRVMTTTHSKWWRRKWRGEVPTEVLPERGVTDPTSRYHDVDRLARALLELPARTRTILSMRFYDDMSEPQIAAILDCPVGTVKSTVSRGLSKLREMDALRSDASDSSRGTR
jgi:RNA polymerase sigma-70 factor (ECF subfamily)